MNKEILNKNDKNQWHGYQEWYYNNKLELRANFKNDNEIGYEEWHSYMYPKTLFYIR